MLSFMQGLCQRLAMAKIDIGGQVRMAAHGCKWPCSLYKLDTLQNYTNSNLFLEFFYLLRFLRSDLRKFWPCGVRNNNNNKQIIEPDLDQLQSRNSGIPFPYCEDHAL